jgi:Flp pilus assembly protein TadD
VESCRRATQLAPGNANAWFNLGLAEEALGRDAEARATLERAAQLSPGFAPAQARLGTLLLKAEQWEDAAERFGRVLALAPEDFDGWCGLGSARRGQGRHEEALDCLEQAGRLRPNAPLLEFQIGLTLVDLGDIAGAAGRFARNIEHLPEFAPAHFNLGNAQRILRRFPEAEASYQRALALQPDYEAAHWNLGLTLLQEGKIADGWEEHEWRWRSALVAAKREWPQPMWDGVASDRTRILVWREQGIGDEIMFLSCFPDLRRAVGHIILTCTPKLRPLLQRSFPGVEIWDDMLMKDPAELDIDCHIPLGSLPRYFRPSVESFPSESGYLKAAPERVAFWTARLGELGPGLKVGISWRSRLMGKGRAETYSRVEDWGPILGVRGVQFISLQYDECGEELARASASAGVPIHRLDGIDLFNDLDDSAALDAALDLVIAPDNSVGELAAALGRPVWRVDNGSDWSTLGTPHRPWQPTMRLFSRPLGTPWQPVLEHIGAELEAWSLRQAAGLCESRSGEVHVQAA